MTIQKAIEIIERKTTIPEEGEFFKDISEAFDIAVDALKEIQKYRAIGTVEECREAMEKQKAKIAIELL